MRLAVSLLLIMSVCAAEANEAASATYRKRANNILVLAMSPAMTRHLSGDADYIQMQFRCRIDRHGRVQGVTLLSSNQPRSTSDALAAALLAAKLPPLPKAVIREQQRDWIDVDTAMVLAK